MRKRRRNPVAPVRAAGSLQGLLTLGVIAMVGLFGLNWLRTRGKALITGAQQAVTETLVKIAPSAAEKELASVLAAPAASVTRPVLRLGSPRTSFEFGYVIEAQSRLGIERSGSFDTNMRNAVIAFQRARGLTPDGVIGPGTWGALLGRIPVASH